MKIGLPLDYNIEFAHIYADERFGPEHTQSIQTLREVTKELDASKKDYCTTILIDEFNPTVFKLDEDKMLREVERQGGLVSFVGYESKFGQAADLLIQELPKTHLRLEYFHRPQKDVLLFESTEGKVGLREDYQFAYRHTCVILSAAWALCRLGALPCPEGAVRKLADKSFCADRLITILQQKYRAGEETVLELIRSTKFADLADKIEYRFI